MLKIVGDINLTDGYFDVGFGIGSKMGQGFDPFRHLERSREDCWIGNFEGVAAEISNKTGISSKQFRVKPECLTNIVHLNLYGLANNHVMQHGIDAYQRTFDFLTSQGCMCFGSKVNKTQLFEHQGCKVSITGFSQRVDIFSEAPAYWHNPEYKEIETELASIPDNVFKIVYLHWGNEFINRPSSQQKRFAHWLVDIGFDLVIGMHPHVLQGYEVYHGKYIFYSLGNFVFDMPWSPTKYGVIVEVDLSEKIVSPNVIYVKITNEFAPQIINEEEVPQEFSFNHLNEQLKKDDNTEEYHAEINKCYYQYRKVNHRDVALKMLHHPLSISSILMDFIKRRI